VEEQTTRREFSQKALTSLLTFSLLDTLYVNDLFGDEIKPLTTKWVASLNDLARDVKDEKIKQLEWQKKVEELLAQVNLKELLQLVNFEQLRRKVNFKDGGKEKGERSLQFQFQQIEGIPTKLVFGKQFFAVKKGHSVAPHGHNNMATAFLILKGDMHGRHYDRVKDEAKHLIIRPTIDSKFGPAQFSTVKDNIHWFTAESEQAFIFNFHVLGLKTEGKKKTGRIYVDPKGEKIQDGLIRARRIDYKEAYKLYG
jgi:hypothetical protein